MARVTVEDCVRYYPNRFELVVLASRRARQVLSGAPVMMESQGDKPTVQSLREMGEGMVSWESYFQVEDQFRQNRSSDSEVE